MATALLITLSVLLALIVLAQDSKSGALAAGFTSAYQFAGVQRTTRYMRHATWILGGAFMLFCLVS